MAVVLRALALLGVAGASLSLFFQELFGLWWLNAFVSENVLSLPNRHRLLIDQLPQDRQSVRAVDRRASRQHLIQHGAQGVDIGAMIDLARYG